MKPLQYPDSDPELPSVMTRGESELHTTIAVSRPWQTSTSQLQVRYFNDPPAAGRIFAEVNGLKIPLDSPVELLPVRVDKPWGEEIWYSGVEARGESRISVEGGDLPLFDYLSLAPAWLCGRAPVILLKMLHSKSEPIAGELYFEIHEHKREVYVVVDVDRDLYPDGIGSVRFGMNQDRRRQFSSDAAFRQAFFEAVKVCESQGIDSTAPDSASRRHMLSFVASEALRQGDSLVVPPGVPHSLQPGLRVVEFQTPVFERRIIYASQPVITQSGWDSASAIADMSLDTPPGPRAADDPDPVLAECPEFSVYRVQLDGSHSHRMLGSPSYTLCISLSGDIRIDCTHSSLKLREGSAAFIPGCAEDVRCSADQSAQILVAVPGP